MTRDGMNYAPDTSYTPARSTSPTRGPFTSLDQLQQARDKAKQIGKRCMVSYAERLLNEASRHAGELIRQGAVGRVLQVLNLAPHNLDATRRPPWFFQKERYGGILTDIGSHQLSNSWPTPARPADVCARDRLSFFRPLYP